MNPAAFSINNRAFVNAAVILTVVIGTWAAITIPREAAPKVSFNWAMVVVLYPGASPAEVEDLIVTPIEEEVQSIEDIDVIVSRARQGRALVWVKFEQISEREFERRADEVRERVSDVEMPEGTEDPEIIEFSTYDIEPVVSLIVRGDVPDQVLHDLSRDLRKDLLDVHGVSAVDSFGDLDPAVLVECDPHRLAAHHLDITDVETALDLANLNLPAGVIKLGGEELLLRTRSDLSGASEVGAVTLLAGAGGSRVRVSDIATVSDGFKDRSIVSRFNSEPSITLSLTKREEGNTLEIVAGVKGVIEEWRDRLPAGVELELTNDQSVFIGDILRVLQSNAVMGLILVIVALFLFVGWRGALVAALGIPVTFLIAIIAMHLTGQSLNSYTLFGLILVLGMVVDDAIVVLENAFRHLAEGKSIRDAATEGLAQVMSPVVISSLTTMGGFLPLVLMPGTIGKVMRLVPIVVSIVLLASLVEALWILPSHFVDIVRQSPRRGQKNGQHRWEMAYLKTLGLFIRKRYVVVVVSIVLLVSSALLIPIIGIDLLGGDNISAFSVFVTLPDGYQLEKSDEVMAEFERHALNLPESELQGVTVNTGIQQQAGEWMFAPHLGQLLVDVVEERDRDRSLDEIIEELRQATADIPGPIQIEFEKRMSGPPTEPPIQFYVKGPDLGIITAATRLLEEELRSIPGVMDVGDDLGRPQRELDVVVDREAASRRGLNPTGIARAVRAAFGGSTATTFRRGEEEIEVVVRYPEDFRTRLSNISNMRFANPSGDIVPFAEVAELVEREGPMAIRHHDMERQITVRANVDTEVTDIARVDRHIVEFFERERSRFPGVHIEPGGQFTEFLDAFNSLTVLFGVGLLLNFMLMAGLFKNWMQPMAIMFVPPLSFIGAMLGLLLSGANFSIATLYGFVALAGVAVNDSIVLVDFINQARAAGYDRYDSLIEAGRVRLRAILLTSLTTIVGLLPMAIGLGGKSSIWQPLATTIAAGLAVATVISLLVIPCLQAILDDISDVAGKAWSRVAA